MDEVDNMMGANKTRHDLVLNMNTLLAVVRCQSTNKQTLLRMDAFVVRT